MKNLGYFKKSLLMSAVALSLSCALSAGGPDEKNSPWTTKAKQQTSVGNLYYRDTGGEGKPVLVCLHANSTSGRFFGPLAEELKSDYRVIAIDAPGHGKSDNATEPQEENYSWPKISQAYLEVLDGLGIQDFNLLGWSKGGHEAEHVLANGNGRVQSLIITGTPPLPMDLSALEDAFKVSLDDSGCDSQFTQEQAAQYMKDSGANSDFAVKTAMRTDGKARILMMQSAIAGNRVDEVETLKSSKVPVLILGGQDDPLINYDYVERLGFPQNVQIKLIPGDHGIPFNAATSFAIEVRTFLKKQ